MYFLFQEIDSNFFFDVPMIDFKSNKKVFKKNTLKDTPKSKHIDKVYKTDKKYNFYSKIAIFFKENVSPFVSRVLSVQKLTYVQGKIIIKKEKEALKHILK